jgi:signal transduction histidine kinase
VFGRLRAWTGRHSTPVDAIVITPLVLACLFFQWISFGEVRHSGPGGPTLGPWIELALAVAMLTPLYWRRRYPVVVFAITALVSFLQWLAHVDLLTANAAILVAMYGVASRCRLRWAIAAGAVAELGALLQVIGNDQSVALTLRAFAVLSAFLMAIWIAGIYANTRRRYVEGLVERAEQAERERDQQAIITAAAERARIARELHDVIAHNVSEIVVHADGAGFALESDPELARQAIQTISTTGRRALSEMRRLVGVLRDGSGEESHLPQPGLAQLGELLEEARASGLPTEFAVYGTPRDVPEGEQLVIYRIVQEALTNTLKHGGPGTRATVEIGFDHDEIKLKISDDGRGVSTLRIKGGHGLGGMRERAAMYGGSVKAGPRIGGGFHVFARIPAGQDG